MTTCFNFIRRIASATRAGSSESKTKGFAVETAQKPQARVHLSPAIINVAVPWLQHSQRFGHWADSQTVCNRRSEISALVEKKMGLEGSRTLIHSGFLAWCNDGSIFEQDIGVFKLPTRKLKSNSLGCREREVKKSRSQEFKKVQQFSRYLGSAR